MKIDALGVTAYCNKCAFASYDKNETICPICNNTLTRLPPMTGLRLVFMSEQTRTEWIAAHSPEPLDPVLSEKRHQAFVDEIQEDRNEKNRKLAERDRQKLKAQENKYGVTCPYCHSKNVKKISQTTKVVETATLGLAGSKRFHNFHCNRCGSDF